jgi:hypothetical protein
LVHGFYYIVVVLRLKEYTITHETAAVSNNTGGEKPSIPEWSVETADISRDSGRW